MSQIQLADGGFLVIKVVSGELPPPIVKDGKLSLISSTEAVDNDGDIIHQRPNENGDGWKLDRFNDKPVILWSHDIWSMNLSGPDTAASVKDLDGLGPSLVIDPLAFDEPDPEAARLKGKVERRSIRESSVGFIGKKSDPIDPDRESGGRHFWEQELIEISMVNRGSNFQTESMLKSMLGRTDGSGQMIADKVETFDNAELGDVKEAVYEMNQRMDLLLKMVKSLVGRPEEQSHAKAEAAVANTDRKAGLQELVRLLKEDGHLE